MERIEPIYTAENCRVSYHLTWSLALFWRAAAAAGGWLDDLSAAAEKDHVRVLRHRFAEPHVSQFLVSTTPAIAPADVVRTVKGRVQYLVRAESPKAFHRNYAIHSVGAARREAIEEYVSSQLHHHRMADPRAQELLARLQIHRPEVDLSRACRSSHGEFVYNLHLVFVNDHRWMEVREDVLRQRNAILLAASGKKGHRLSRVGVFADHLHLTLGCNVTESPEQVALGYLNNLAYVEGMRPVYQFGYYVGAFGEYDFGAMRQ